MSLFPQPHVVDAIGESLLHFLWQGLLIGALLELVLVALRDASSDVRYLARCGALAAMAAAPLITFWLVLEGGQPAVPVVATALAPEAVLGAAPQGTFLRAVVALWALGASALCLRTAGGWLHLRVLCAGASGELPSPWRERFQVLARELRVRATAVVVDSASVAVPTVIGWLKPVVLVPARVLTGLGPGEIEALLAHELAHVKRADYLVNLLQSLLESLLFFHPVVWRVSSGIRAEREFCCDDVALALTGDGVQFARALTELESWRGEEAQLAVSTLGGSLMHRIQRMIGIQTSAPRRGVRIGQALAALVAAGSLGAVALGFSTPDAHEVHVHEGCQRCERSARREHERLAERDALERHIEEARAELAALRELLASERTARRGERGRIEELIHERARADARAAEMLVEVRDDHGEHVGDLVVEIHPDHDPLVEVHPDHRLLSVERHGEDGGATELLEIVAETDDGEILEFLVERHADEGCGEGPLPEEVVIEELLRERHEHARERHEHAEGAFEEKLIVEELLQRRHRAEDDRHRAEHDWHQAEHERAHLEHVVEELRARERANAARLEGHVQRELELRERLDTHDVDRATLERALELEASRVRDLSREIEERAHRDREQVEREHLELERRARAHREHEREDHEHRIHEERAHEHKEHEHREHEHRAYEDRAHERRHDLPPEAHGRDDLRHERLKELERAHEAERMRYEDVRAELERVRRTERELRAELEAARRLEEYRAATAHAQKQRLEELHEEARRRYEQTLQSHTPLEWHREAEAPEEAARTGHFLETLFEALGELRPTDGSETKSGRSSVW